MEDLPPVARVSAVFIAGPGPWYLLLEVSGEHSGVTAGLRTHSSYFSCSAARGPLSITLVPLTDHSARVGWELEQRAGALCWPDC